jgi:hypothetical protein
MLKPMHSVSQSNNLSRLAYFVLDKPTDTTPLTLVLIEQCLHPTFRSQVVVYWWGRFFPLRLLR